MTELSHIIVSTAYFPPISYFYLLNKAEKVFMEYHENYTKQSYRNRCKILSPNGEQTLSIPVVKKSGEKQLIKDVKPDYKNNWQKQHLKSLETAYLSSPFYEFYIDAFRPFFETKHPFLFDLNIRIIETLLSELQIEKELNFTENFQKKYPYKDLRTDIHPKKDYSKINPDYKTKTYTQVFSDKFDFVPNLSILDLLFNEGPRTLSFLIK